MVRFQVGIIAELDLDYGTRLKSIASLSIIEKNLTAGAEIVESEERFCSERLLGDD